MSRKQGAKTARRTTGRGGKALSIGWISTVSDQGNTGRYHTEMMDAVRVAVKEIGGHLLVFSLSDGSPAELCRRVSDAGLDGIIVTGPARRDPIRLLLNTDMPAVLIDDSCRGRRVDTILVDNEAGGYQAVEHLVSLGHHAFGVVTGPRQWKVTRDRLEGAMEALEDAGLYPSAMHVIESDFSPQGGYKAMRQMLKKKPRPTAVFFFNDEMASGGLQALHEFSDLRVPEDISFVGFDDTLWASMMQPPLTTIRVEKWTIGREAVTRLLMMIKGKSYRPLTQIVPTRLIIRKSTKSAPKAG